MMSLDKDDRLIISIRTEVVSVWPFIYLYMVTRLPNLQTTKRVRLKRKYYKRRRAIIDAYIDSYDLDTKFCLRDAAEFFDHVEEEYQTLRRDRKKSYYA
jgi:hypothetical protein